MSQIHFGDDGNRFSVFCEERFEFFCDFTKKYQFTYFKMEMPCYLLFNIFAVLIYIAILKQYRMLDPLKKAIPEANDTRQKLLKAKLD
jgi:hypothetical protein